MSMRWVDPRELIPTQMLGDMIGSITALVDVMRSRGYDPAWPIEVVEHNDQWYVLEGHHRLAAALLLAIPSVPVVPVAELPGGLTAEEFVADAPVSARYDFMELWGKAE